MEFACSAARFVSLAATTQYSGFEMIDWRGGTADTSRDAVRSAFLRTCQPISASQVGEVGQSTSSKLEALSLQLFFRIGQVDYLLSQVSKSLF